MPAARKVAMGAVALTLFIALVGLAPTPASAGVSFDASTTIDDGVASVVPGETTTYTVVVSNEGPGSASGTVTLSFPGAVGAWTCAGAGGATCASAGAPTGPVNGTITSLPSGGAVTFTVPVTIPPSSTGIATASAEFSPVGDTDDGNDSAQDDDVLTPEADVSVTKTDGLTVVQPAQTVVYAVVATNAGPSTVDVVVTDVFPPDLQDVSWTCAPGGGAECEAANGTGNISSTDLAMPPGGSLTFTVTATVSPSATPGATIVNIATAIPLQQIDGDMLDNIASDADTVGAAQATTTSTATTTAPTSTTPSTAATTATTARVGAGALARTGSSTDGPTDLALVVLGGGLVLVGAAELRRRRATVG